MGHVRDLPADKLGVDIQNDFAPAYVVLRQKGRTIRALRDALRDTDRVVLATDPDREGEAIAWHLLQILKPGGKSVQRVTFHAITPEAIHDAFLHPRPGLDMNLVYAQQARRVLDRLVGYQVSPLLWKTRRGQSAGRVQSVALRLVVDREREIRSFTPREYWSLIADLAKPVDLTQHFLARLVQVGNKRVGLDQPIELKSRADADLLVAVLKNAEYRVKSVQQEQKARKPWPPFTTSTLQQSASARLGMSPADTMKLAQQLYEGIDAGAGQLVGLITYMRTDSTAIAPEAQQQARQMVTQTLGERYLPATAPTYRTRIKNAQEAHEAIRPTDVFRYPNNVKEHLSDRQYRLYDLIWRRFVASQMAPALYDVTTITVTATLRESFVHIPFLAVAESGSQPDFLFRAVGRELKFDGFLRVWQEAEEHSDDEDAPQKIPSLQVAELLALLELTAQQHFTQPPARYTEATLVKALEERGIGRPSTYASIVQTLQERAYVLLEARHLVPTPSGETTCDALVTAFPGMMDYRFTEQVEDWLDDVSRGEITWVKALRDFYVPFAQALELAEARMRAVPFSSSATNSSEKDASTCVDDLGGDASRLGGVETAKRRTGWRRTKLRSQGGKGSRKGRSPIASRRVAKPAASFKDVVCPLCGAPMVERSGPHGTFLGCSRFPKCKGTRNQPSETNIKDEHRS